MTAPPTLVIFGRQPELGRLELECVLGPGHMTLVLPNVGIIDVPVQTKHCGGVVKVGSVIYDGEVRELIDVIPPAQLDGEGKMQLAVSCYGTGASSQTATRLGLGLKKQLRALDRSVRLVAPVDNGEVSAAQLKFNHVLERGLEVCVVRAGRRMVVAVTTDVQDIDWYSRRDYGRPARSATVGMLPPKLAQVMVNSVDAPLIVDPFCGTGVVLQEALLLGKRALGADLSADMVLASRTNLDWLVGERPEHVMASSWQVLEPTDARSLVLPHEPLAIVTEGYLGPNLMAPPTAGQLHEIRLELLPLYREVLKNWSAQLPAKTDITITLPAWRQTNGWAKLGLLDELGELGYTIKVLEHATIPLVYARHDQTVGRQLLLLRKT